MCSSPSAAARARKGFKNKNLKIFDGLPALAITALLRRSCSSGSRPDLAVDVCLNTDSGLLIDVVTKKYPEVTVLPPPARSCAATSCQRCPCTSTACGRWSSKTGYEYDTLIDLDITSPLRQTGDIEGAYEVKASPAGPGPDFFRHAQPPHTVHEYGKAREETMWRSVIDHHNHRAPADAACVRHQRVHLCVRAALPHRERPRALSGTANAACTRCSTPASSTSIPKRTTC